MADYEAHQLPNGDILLRKTVRGGGCFAILLVLPFVVYQYGSEKVKEWRKESRLASAQHILTIVPIAIVVEEVNESINGEVTKQANQIQLRPLNEAGRKEKYSIAMHLCSPTGIKPSKSGPTPIALFSDMLYGSNEGIKVFPNYNVVYAIFEGGDSMDACKRWLTQNGYVSKTLGTGSSSAWTGEQKLSLSGVTRDELLKWDDWSYPGDDINLQRSENNSQVRITCWYRSEGKLFVWYSSTGFHSNGHRIPHFSEVSRDEAGYVEYWTMLKQLQTAAPSDHQPQIKK